MSIITISSIFNFEYDDYETYCNTVIGDFITTTPFEDTLNLYIYLPIWLRYRDTPIKFNNDDKGKDDFLRNFNNQLTEVVFDFHNYAKENIEYFLYQNDTTKQGKPMSKTITSGIAPINQTIDQEVDSTNLASGTGSQFVSETVYNGIAWHKLVEGYFTPNRKTALLKAFQWLFVSVYSPETKYNDKIGIKATVPLDMADGDQVIVPDKDYLTYDQVTVEKPDTMIPENIVKDIDIGGVVGTYEPNLTEVTENSDLTQNQVITTPSGYDAMSKVTIVPPATAIPSNIKKDVNIGGVVGTYEQNILNYLDYPLDLTGDMDIEASDYNVEGIKEVFIGIPATAKPENIKAGVNIGGIIGNYLGADTLEKRISGNQTYTYANNNITALNAYAFYQDKNITSFSSTSCITVNREVFNSCTNLTSVSLPNVTTFDSYGYQFNYCTSLTSISLPKVTSIAHSVFSQCYALTTLDLPEVTQVTYNAISYCNALTTLTLPKCTLINQSGIVDNSNLTSIYLPLCASLGNRALYSNSALTDIYLGKTDGICALNASNGIPASSTQHLTIHVPSSLIVTYQTATNWSTHYNNGYITFVAI